MIDAATEAGYHDLQITDVPHMEDVLEIERLLEKDEVVTDRGEEPELDPGR